DPKGKRVEKLARASTENGLLLISATGPKEVALLTLKKKKSLMGEGKVQEILKTLPLPGDGTISALAVDIRGEDLYAGLRAGQTLRADLRDLDNRTPAAPIMAASKPGTAISALGFLNGDRTLLVGDDAGAYASWQLLRSEEGGYFMTRMAFFDPHEAPLVAFSPSLRDKGFISADPKGGVHLNHSIAVNTRARLKAPSD